jgi:hypothetical protein|tara:strand:- start:191 stop:412 length:222 start_codon:yes stop_codon:yes gene_type:complete
MYIKDLMNYLEHFIDGKKGNAINNAKIYMKVGPYLEEVKRIDVEESSLIGDGTVRVVFKPTKKEIIRALNIPE